MANKEARIQRAREIFFERPEIGRREVNVILRREFGVGLRDATLGYIGHELNRPAALKGRLYTKAFTRNERKAFRKFLDRGNPPYVRDAINHRWEMYRDLGWQAKKDGKSFAQFLHEFRAFCKQEYKDKGWSATTTTRTKDNPRGRVKGYPDPYEMLRDFRNRSIDEGEYDKPEDESPKTNKGNIKAQKRRYQEKQSAKSQIRQREMARARVEKWMSELDEKIVRSTGERRKQLEEQRDNLERSLDNLR